MIIFTYTKYPIMAEPMPYCLHKMMLIIMDMAHDMAVVMTSAFVFPYARTRLLPGVV